MLTFQVRGGPNSPPSFQRCSPDPGCPRPPSSCRWPFPCAWPTWWGWPQSTPSPAESRPPRAGGPPAPERAESDEPGLRVHVTAGERELTVPCTTSLYKERFPRWASHSHTGRPTARFPSLLRRQRICELWEFCHQRATSKLSQDYIF